MIDAAGEIYGDVANIAARVQALADPGEVVVTARVQHQIAGLFVAESRGMHTLKGVPEPTALFRLVRASGGGRRSGQRNLTPLVGRDDETAMLMRHWERARHGDGQLVLIVGEPGLRESVYRRISSPAVGSAAHLDRIELLTAPAEHSAASDHRMGPPAIWRCRRARERRLADLESTLDTGQDRPGGECRHSRADPRHSADRMTASRFSRRRNCGTDNWRR